MFDVVVESEDALPALCALSLTEGREQVQRSYEQHGMVLVLFPPAFALLAVSTRVWHGN